jgi:geranylgeranyl diphosphate synthase type II
MIFNLKSYLNKKAKRINGALLDILQEPAKPSRILKAMKYALMAGGKRIRPVLCIAAAEAVGNENPNILKAACALEVVHTYSLIHDDLPAMDDDDLRRGKPTCHIAFDEATAILAGDALLTLAFKILSSIKCRGRIDMVRLLRIIHTVSSAAGYKGMIEGQMRDLSSENSRLDIEELSAMHALKTGALIEASVNTGILLGEGNEKQIKQLGIYATNIGLAFQVADDILNVEGDTEIMGKAVGTDEIRKKNTFPSLLGIEKSKAFGKELVNNALQALDDFDSRSDPLRGIASYIIERKR